MKKNSVGVIGLGYVGLPLAVEFCRAGFQVFGVDDQMVDTRKYICERIDPLGVQFLRNVFRAAHPAKPDFLYDSKAEKCPKVEETARSFGLQERKRINPIERRAAINKRISVQSGNIR